MNGTMGKYYSVAFSGIITLEEFIQKIKSWNREQ